MSRRHDGCDHELAFNRLTVCVAQCLGDGDLNKIAGLHFQTFRKARAHERGVVPSQLCDWIRQFLEPAVVDVTAVIHGITADKDDLRRTRRRRGSWRPKLRRLCKSRRGGCVKTGSSIAQWNVRRESIPKKTRPGRLKIARWRRRAKCFLHELGPFHFRHAEQHVHQFNFRQPAEERQDHGLDRQVGAVGCKRVTPRFKIMRGGNVPATQRRSCILVVTEPHNFRHFFLQVGPIKRQFRRLIGNQAAVRVINWIASQNEQLRDAPLVYVCRQLQNAGCSRIARKFADNQGRAEVFQRRIDGVNEQLYDGRLVRTGQDQTCSRFCHQIVGRFAQPSVVESRRARRHFKRRNQRTQTRIFCRSQNFSCQRVRKH